MTDNSGGGPIKYIALHPCPENGAAPVTLSLPVPATALEAATEEQRRKIALIQIAFAQRVSRALSRAYGEVAAVLEDGTGNKVMEEGR